jgi:glucose-6-phosphate 1-epimerase
MNPELRRHIIPGVAVFADGPGGLTVLEVQTVQAAARIFLHGAQLTHWQPAGAQPVIFLSRESAFTEGKAIRGGVPVCFPWFGPREGQPAHGFVRNKTWSVEALRKLEDGSVRAIFFTASDDTTRTQWPHDFLARLTYNIGTKLTMELEVENTSREPFTFSEALHTYFVVGDARQAFVRGLEGAQYRDFPDRSVLLTQDGPIHFTGEVDRVYVNTRSTCVLHDPVLRRRILVEKDDSDTTTVWNPWTAKAAALADFGNNEWKEMVCIETVNAAENSVTLPGGESHRMTTRISLEAI